MDGCLDLTPVRIPRPQIYTVVDLAIMNSKKEVRHFLLFFRLFFRYANVVIEMHILTNGLFWFSNLFNICAYQMKVIPKTRRKYYSNQ